MLRNYLLTAVRNFRKNRFYATVNVIGLSIGITSCLVVFAILRHELRFDAFHKNAENIYRIVEHYLGDNGMEYSGILPNALAKELSAPGNLGGDVIPMFGPLESVVEFDHENQHRSFKETHVVFATGSFLNTLDFPVLRGAPSSSLDVPLKVFLTEKLASKYFGQNNAIGQVITYDEAHQLEVVGILADPPGNTNMPFDMIISFSSADIIYGDYARSWGAYWTGSAYYIHDGNRPITEVASMMTTEVHKHFSKYEQERKTYHLQPLSEVHTDTRYERGANYVAPTEVMVGFILLAVITLVASILNFVNLATAQAVRRSKEVGIRKTLGSSKSSLVLQFIGETFILVVFATLLAFTIGQFFILKLNELLSVVRFEIGYDLAALLFAASLTIVVSFLAGFYPATILSGYNPINALNNQISLKKGSGKSLVRKGLVITQFLVANLLIITTVIVAAQMKFVKSKDLGFDQENVLIINFPNKLTDKMPLIREAYASMSFVQDATWSMGAPQSQSNWGSNYSVEGSRTTEDMEMILKFVDQNYLDLFKIPLIAGRNLVHRATTDTTKHLLVSREFLKRANVPLEDALGKKVKFFGSWKGEIVGVIEDYHVFSLQDEIMPVILTYNPPNMTQINLKLADINLGTKLSQIEGVFREFAPTDYFEATLLNDLIAESYIVENLVYTAFQVFAALAILIGVFGLYGLVSFMATSNRKNISIRKVFGASMTHILRAFSSEYLLLMTIAFVLATPFSYLICREWLNGFRYQIDISFGYFVTSFFISGLITALTIGRKSIMVARSNPIDALRYE